MLGNRKECSFSDSIKIQENRHLNFNQNVPDHSEEEADENEVGETFKDLENLVRVHQLRNKCVVFGFIAGFRWIVLDYQVDPLFCKRSKQFNASSGTNDFGHFDHPDCLDDKEILRVVGVLIKYQVERNESKEVDPKLLFQVQLCYFVQALQLNFVVVFVANCDFGQEISNYLKDEDCLEDEVRCQGNRLGDNAA